MLQSATKQQSSPISAAKLLVDYKSTPTSVAAYRVDEAIRSAIDPELLRTVDSAIGEVFYSTVFRVNYGRIRNAILATWRAAVPRS